MDTALIASGPASVRPMPHTTLLERISRRTGLALLAWSRMAGQRPSHEDMAALHERQREADRLREERFRAVAVNRLI